MPIRLLLKEDREELIKYLAPYKSECMFICSNLEAVGIEYKGADLEGQYYGYFNHSSKKIEGVIVHYWNDNIIMYCNDNKILEELAVFLKDNTKRSIKGILGPNKQAEYVIEKLNLSSEAYSMNQNEELYEIDLEKLEKQEIGVDFDIVMAEKVEKEILIQWMKAYEIEALGKEDHKDLDKIALEDANRLIKMKNCWILLLKGIPVSMSAFNARLKDMVQVGPVWTPPEYRNQGFARLLLRHTLVEEKIKETKKAILFTKNPAAIKVYEKIGFSKIGNFRLALLRNPVYLSKG